MPVKTIPIRFDEEDYKEAGSLKGDNEAWPAYVLRLVRENKEIAR
jgi:hypothetical protein